MRLSWRVAGAHACAGHMDKLTAVATLNALFPRCFSMKQLGTIFEEGCKLVDVNDAAPPETWTQSAFVRVRSRGGGGCVSSVCVRVSRFQFVTILSEKLV